MRRPRLRGVVLGALACAVVVGTAAALGLEPEPVRVVLLVLLVVAGARLLVESVSRVAVLWYPVPVHPPVGEGRDQVTQSHLRLLENHQTSRRPDAAVRDRLAVLADQVLTVRHGVHAHSERGRELLGAELVEVLHGPVVRLNPRRIDRVLRQIEEL
ncbi:hypothetical protein [Nocardioides sp.]|uniref:hypothetical protein n=1 Tax=Nocardioides sp. TaxID=35761 RepID=UPI00271826E6|nr:hypothetical protein [Nocardioides sp.]MDO9456153.1 hypothetical protein [Nocardioides sp.]